MDEEMLATMEKVGRGALAEGNIACAEAIALLLREIRRLRASQPAPYLIDLVVRPPFDVTCHDDGFVAPPATFDANAEPADGFAPHVVEG